MGPDRKISTEVSGKELGPISYFEKDASFTFVYQKTEKLASAVYMVTNLFSEQEPMKWTLRKKVSELVSFAVGYKDVTQFSQSEFGMGIKSRVLELVSFLEISMRGGLISQMNFSILKQEFLNLANVFDTSDHSQKDISQTEVSKTFLEVRKPSVILPESTKDIVEERKETAFMSSIKDNSTPAVNQEIFKRSNRQNIILNLLKKKKEITIKDISQVIKDCSEKTIQRELISFIAAGVLKRTGERRWSKYSLNQ